LLGLAEKSQDLLGLSEGGKPVVDTLKACVFTGEINPTKIFSGKRHFLLDEL